jgi:hypothetical protein
MALYTVQSTYPPAAADLNQAISLLSGQSGPMAGGITIANRIRAQITGATATSGLVGMTAVNGATTGGPPTSGTWALGDLMVDPVLICLWVCTTAGTPGTWYRIGSGNTSGGMIVDFNGQAFTTRTGRTGFDIKVFDFVAGAGIMPMPGSSAVLSAITVQYGGTYLFQGTVTLGGGTVGADIGVILLKNGQPYIFGSQFLGYGTPIITVTGLMTVVAGDVVQIGVYSEGTYSTFITNAQTQLFGTFMSN